MNTREKFSTGLICLGLILAFLPRSANLSLSIKPDKLLPQLFDGETDFSVDQVAGFIIKEDSSVQLIDIRSPEEFKNMNIPGSVNIPYDQIIDIDPVSYLKSRPVRNIFYSNGDLNSSYALVIAKGMNYSNTYVMKGGLNEWFSTVMNSSFTGGRITARENALFETRTRARKLFTEINSLPDSLKMKFLLSKQNSSKKLDGGCE